QCNSFQCSGLPPRREFADSIRCYSIPGPESGRARRPARRVRSLLLGGPERDAAIEHGQVGEAPAVLVRPRRPEGRSSALLLRLLDPTAKGEVGRLLPRAVLGRFFRRGHFLSSIERPLHCGLTPGKLKPSPAKSTCQCRFPSAEAFGISVDFAGLA